MLDPRLIRENPKLVKETLKARQLDIKLVDEFLEKDKRYRELKLKLDKLRHKSNLISEEINKLKKENRAEEAEKKINEAREIAKEIAELEDKVRKYKQELDKIMLVFPNLVSKEVPKKEKIVEEWGKLKRERWQKSYIELNKKLKLIDFESAVGMSGEGFYVLTNEGAMLQRALINFCLDVAIKNGYKEQFLPVLLNKKAVTASGHLPKFEEGMYKTTDGFYLSPTEEVPLLNLYAGKKLSHKELPINLTAYMLSFRTEKGATKGIVRAHQFDEVELFKITKQEESSKELVKMVNDATKPLKLLKLPYRIKLLPAYEIAFQSAITYDIDVYASVSGWLEVSSCSNCLDFQARRARIFYFEKGQKKLVHTLNGTGLGINRLFVALLENYQQKDGSVKIPKVLQKYCGIEKIEPK
ncbi:serine--tRNA ligase [Candidatus Pacearchaeota archaeon ex4484_31]|nr:MAG: serine--tRNA ligase [Candidatus Pacearchaeota archaeon ex4484_31]